jgi:hypothetical protein
MIVYVSGAPRDSGGDWFGSKYLPDIHALFDGPGNSIHLPDDSLINLVEPSLIYSVVLFNITASDCGVTFLGTDSSGSIVEASLLAAQGKPQVIVADAKLLQSHLLRGLPEVIGFADYENDKEVRMLLEKLSSGRRELAYQQ